RSRARLSFGLAFLMMISAQSGVFMDLESPSEELSDLRIMESTTRSVNLVDVPAWKINDAWSYDGYLDVGAFVASSGVSSNVQYLEGTLTQTVSDIGWCDVDNDGEIDWDLDLMCYKVEGDAYYEAQDVNLDGQDGDLIVHMDTEEWISVSDLSVFREVATFNIDFEVTIWWWTVTEDIADLTVTNDYYPTLEGYDFPLSVGEVWETDYTVETDYSGTSDYVTIPSDSSSSNTTSWEIVSQGYPGTFYNGCSQSYNITNYDDNGDEAGYKWYCPAIRGDIRTSYSVAGLGIQAEHELTTYQAAGRGKQVIVEIEYPLSPLDFEMSAWINVTSQGQPVSDEYVRFRYEIGAYDAWVNGGNDVAFQHNLTTASNGSAFLTFNTGHLPDGTTSQGELGSHGIIVWASGSNPVNTLVGATTVTIDPEVHAIDLVSRSEGVTVERTRGNRTVTLDNNIGFNAIPDDQLTFSVPVLNRGLLNSPATTLLVEAPDGSASSTEIPSLSSLEEMRVDVIWVVPEGQQSGDISLTFTVDPNEEIAADGNRSNNEGSFSLFIGRLPVASLAIASESLTMTEVSFNGLSSYDPDGGFPVCEFTVEKLDGESWTSLEEDCVQEYTWDDDGTFLVSLTITDDESDQDHAEAYITILNRPPEVEIGVDQSSVPVLSSVTFDVEESGDLDTLNEEAPVEIQWHLPCDEGQVGVRCTVTPESEGPFTMGVTVMDDDGATTEDTLTIEVTNIPPTNPRTEVWLGGNRLIPQMLGENARYTVNEGDVLILKGWADDSANDLGGLQHHWSPDAELQPDMIISSTGHQSEIGHTYDISGQHLATLQVVDDDGASTETVIIQFLVSNLAPSISPVAPLLPVTEDELVQLSIGVSDTLGDMPNLIACYDLDPYANSDSEGNATDDCDLETQHLAHSWPDATTAPDHIVFHVTDDDGERASIAISIDVRNVDPDPRASTSDYNPTVGDVIVLSANGTTDSQFDMENMLYVWDLDIGKDSDGDGDPTNDIDRTGPWIEVSFSSEGTRTVQMTALDEGEGSSMTLVIEVKKEPFSFGGMMADYGLYFVLLGLILILVTVLVQRMRPSEVIVEAPVVENVSRRRGRKISMDDAFDDPEYDPFDSDKKKRGPKRGPDRPDTERASPEPERMDGDLAGAFEELTGESPQEESVTEESTGTVAASVDEALDNEDIEALFDD
ncbi:MAG: CARDB domain-containing protein, partial [Candidatus Thermoplasmatota archaeon]|nr:CARDB domain-containing protein [Candidatus Thermoplasmatota archaeon]